MNDRDCIHCKHKVNGACNVWECKFEPMRGMTNEEAIRFCDEYLSKNISDIDKEFLKKAKEALQRESCEKTQMVDKSNFSQEQYRADLQSAYDCGKASVAPCEDAISRKAVLDTLERMDKALDEYRTVESYKDLLRECYKVLPSVTPKPKSECEHDHEILKAYSDGASAVLESIKYLIEQYERCLELLDADMKDGSATIVTKTKYAVYTEVVEQLKEVEVQE